jgi:hypothetical protein
MDERLEDITDVSALDAIAEHCLEAHRIAVDQGYSVIGLRLEEVLREIGTRAAQMSDRDF